MRSIHPNVYKVNTDFVSKRLTTIKKIAFDNALDSEYFQMAFYINLIAGISSIIYSRNLNDNDKFISLIIEYCDWKYKYFISIPFLNKQLKSSQRLLPLPKEIQDKLAEFNSNNNEYTWNETRDINLIELRQHHDLINLILSNNNYNLLKKASYPSMLYRLRNDIVHESQLKHFPYPDDKFGYQHNVSSGLTLNFTAQILYEICDGILSKIRNIQAEIATEQSRLGVP